MSTPTERSEREARDRRIARLPFPDIDGAFVYLSGRLNRDGANGCEAVASFVYIDGDIACEWEPRCGPIQLWFASEEGAEGAIQNYVFPWVDGSGHWSQMAVEREQLPQLFAAGYYDLIFATLRRWVESRKPDTASEASASPHTVSPSPDGMTKTDQRKEEKL